MDLTSGIADDLFMSIALQILCTSSSVDGVLLKFQSIFLQATSPFV